MATRNPNQSPVKLFFAVMTSCEQTRSRVEAIIEKAYSPIDHRDMQYAFDPLTNYYRDEFGSGLKKQIFSTTDLVGPRDLVDVKIHTNAIEALFARGPEPSTSRTINIDPGYLNHSKVVLATTKDHAHRLYIDNGIFEEITLNFHRREKGYLANAWTYPDYQMPERLAFFGAVRETYSRQLKEAGA